MKIFRLIPFLFLLPALSYPAETSVSIRAEQPEIAMGEQTAVVVELSEEATKIEPPALENAELRYAGKGSSTSISIVNGKASQKSSIMYNFIFIPSRKGNFTIPSFIITVGGKTLGTEPLQIKVTAAGKGNNSRYDPFAEFEDMFRRSRPRIPEIYLRLNPSKNMLRQNEQNILTMEQMTTDPEVFKWQLAEASPVFFDKMQSLDISQTVQKETIRREGEWYIRAVKRYVLFPVDAGDLAIRAPVLVAISPYGQLKLISQDIALRVKPSAESGGIAYIGRLRVKALLSTNSIPLGSSVELSYEMEGDGNLKLYADPLRDRRIDGIFLSAPVVKSDMTGFDGQRAIFRQKVTYSLLAQKEGKMVVPPLALSVTSGDGAATRVDVPALSLFVLPAAAVYRGNSVPFKAIGHPANRKFVFSNPVSWIWIALCVLFAATGWLYGRHRLRMENDPAYSKRFLSKKKLGLQLADASALLEAGKTPDFHRELQKALFYYVADLYDLPAGIPLADFLERFRQKKPVRGAVEEFEKLCRACSSAAYGGSAGESPVELLERAKTLLSGLRKK